MKVGNIGGRAVVIDGTSALDVAVASNGQFGSGMTELFDRWEEFLAWAHVAGLCVGQDLSERTVQFAAGMQFSLGKSYRGFGPFGPWLVTPDEVDDPDDLVLGCSINGVTVQDDRTSGLIFGVPSLIAQLSAVLPLLPGDVLFTGTPAGVGQGMTPARFLVPGDVIDSWVDGIGQIRTSCVAGPAVC